MSEYPAQYNVDFYSGNDDPFIITWIADGEPVNLDGYSSVLVVKKSRCVGVPVEFSIVGVIDEPATGEIVFPFSSAEKQSLLHAGCSNSVYVYDIVMTNPGGEGTVIITGNLTINLGVAP